MAPTFRRTAKMFPLVVAAGLLLASCSSAPTGLPVPAESAIGAAATSDSATSVPDAAGGTAGAAGQNHTVALDTSVRIANTFLTPKGQQPTAIDVWIGSPTEGGKKMVTVPYGTVSSYFAPEVPDPTQSQYFTLNFYPAGATSDDDLLGNKSETGATGLELTMQLAPTDPSDSGSLGMSMKVYADSVGANPGSSGFTHQTLPSPTAGKSVLLLDATALQGRMGPNGAAHGLTPSSVDGKCLPYFETDSTGLEYSGKLHDMASDTVELFGGTTDKVYPVSPGSQVRVNQQKQDQLITAACADTPVFGPFDPKLSAGKGAYGFLYGSDLAHAKVLLIPVG